MRHCRPSKQRLWLGPGGHFCRCKRRIANTNAYGYSDGYCYTYGHANVQPHGNSIGNGHAATDANTQVGTIGKAASHASAQAIGFRRTDFWW
jgi:hypothetical protein